MKQRLLLFFVMSACITSLQAQQAEKNAKPITGYAITAIEKGGKSWKEVRLVDIGSGAIVKNVYDSKTETEPLNARTGKAVVMPKQTGDDGAYRTYTTTLTTPSPEKKKVVNLDQELDKANGQQHTVTYTRTIMIRESIPGNKPFSTNSAAMAYDKKHERLYYTPMSIAQLRYIDLKSGKIYYFENESFGTVKGMGDIQNQITRMVISADGNGYAITNDANHLIRFTTGKDPVITDLGSINDDAANTKYSVHSPGGYGGDVVADASNNLYLIMANRNVFKVNVETRVATHLGKINGLPAGFSTNGAMVETGSKVIIASSESTVGYYRFDLLTLEAEKVSGSPDVFNASDLANGNLAFEKAKKERKHKDEVKDPVVQTTDTKSADDFTARPEQADGLAERGISVYPNPVTNGIVNLSFNDQPAGKYQVQLLDMSGRLISAKEVTINGASQIESFKFPELSVGGNYLLKVSNEVNKISVTNKLVVQ
jgi:hypothetical protein